MASPGNRHCASCIGTLSFPIDVNHWSFPHTLENSAAKGKCCGSVQNSAAQENCSLLEFSPTANFHCM